MSDSDGNRWVKKTERAMALDRLRLPGLTDQGYRVLQYRKFLAKKARQKARAQTRKEKLAAKRETEGNHATEDKDTTEE